MHVFSFNFEKKKRHENILYAPAQAFRHISHEIIKRLQKERIIPQMKNDFKNFGMF